jgi:hypothetical protein
MILALLKCININETKYSVKRMSLYSEHAHSNIFSYVALPDVRGERVIYVFVEFMEFSIKIMRKFNNMVRVYAHLVFYTRMVLYMRKRECDNMCRLFLLYTYMEIKMLMHNHFTLVVSFYLDLLKLPM